MSHIVKSNQNPFFELVNDPAQLEQVATHMLDAVLTSFATDVAREPFGAFRQPKHSEVKRRSEIYIRVFKTMRKDVGYSLAKTLDLVGTALRYELDGVKYELPKADESWIVPGQSRSMEADLTERIKPFDEEIDG